MRTIHLVYAIPPLKPKFIILDFVVGKIFKSPLYRYFPLQVLDWPRPVYAPYSITKNLIETLSTNHKIRLYGLKENVDLDLKDDDIFLGHLWPDFSSKAENDNEWICYDDSQISNKVVLKYPHDPRVFAIGPFNHSLKQCGWMLPLSKYLKNYIAICGDYWILNLDNSDFANVFENIFQIRMAIDSTKYPFLRKSFNPVNNRKFIYIGRLSSEKNIEMLERIAATVEGFQGGFIGNGEIKGWKKIDDFVLLTPEYVQQLSKEYDFFINLSTYDAQVTTVLEAACWGFVVCCTLRSGYEEDEFVKMSHDDLQYNVDKIATLQGLDSNILLAKVYSGREKVINKYSWAMFNNKINELISR